jgi:hypothetical protein
MHKNFNIGLFLFFLFTAFYSWSQTEVRPVAKFTFNNGSNRDEIGGLRAKLVNTKFTQDRFGNENNAVYIFGNPSSYINLGNSPALKPRAGSISLWVSVEAELWSGTGYTVNPILLTKNSGRDDFFEAYAIAYVPETNRMNASASKNDSGQTCITTVKEFELFKWHHLVLTYDDKELSFYVDGNHEQTLEKNFPMIFNPLDSVIAGVTNNRKNNRYSQLRFDDIEFYDKVLNAEQVSALYHAPNPNKNRIIAGWTGIIAASFLSLFIIYRLIRFQISKTHRKEKEKLELANKMLETELRVNRALMNPHFIFNSLNALHDLILSKQWDLASDYLVKFSKLIRKNLDSNHSGLIYLDAEIEMLYKYLEIVSMRFDKKISHHIVVNESLIPSAVKIPVMLLQPFVENAIWHGLLNKKGEKRIDIEFSRFESRYVKCSIEDNGLGRQQLEQKTGKKSLATNFVIQRLELLNKIHKLDCELEIIDKPHGTGTIVNILLPVLEN